MRSANGDITWKLGEWQEHKGNLVLCESGFHACKTPRESLQYTLGDQWVKVQYAGKVLEGSDKIVVSKMRVVAKIDTKVAAVKFAVWCARQSLHFYEEKYPNDKRPREAIEAAEKWLEDHTYSVHAVESAESARSAAESAAWSAARSAESAAESAAWSAAWSARSAAESAAWSAAWSAESAAESAAWSAAESAAWSAAWSARSARSAQDKQLDKIIEECLIE